MLINSITLHNFKSHKDSHISFNKGISLILGSNGAGKSSIFEAISYSFFKIYDGTLEDITRKPINENDIIDEMKVIVEFEIGGTHYKLQRGRKNSQSNVSLVYKEKDKYVPYCKTEKEVTEELENLLGIDSKSFKNAIYIKQGEITELIDKTAAEKKEFIAKLLNIDYVEKAWEEIKTVINKYEFKKSENDGQLFRKKDVDSKIKDLQELIEKNQQIFNEKSPLLKSTKEDLDNKLKLIEESDNKKTEFNELKNQLTEKQKFIDHIRLQKEDLEKKLSQINEYEKECIILEKYDKKLPLYKELKGYESDKKNIIIQLENVNSQIEMYNNNKNTLKENKELYHKYIETENELNELNDKRKSVEEQVKNNQKIPAQLEEKNKRKKYLFNEIRNLSDKVSRMFNENFNNPEEIENKVIKEKTRITEEKNDLTNKINTNNEIISAKQNELKNTTKSLDDLENTKEICPICQSPISHDKHNELSENYRNKIDELQKNIKELDNSNETLKIELDESNNKLQTIEEINTDLLKDQYDEFKELIKDIADLDKLIPQISKDENELNELDSTLEEKQEYMNSIKNNYNKYIVANENITVIDIEKITKDKEELETKLSDLKNKCRDIIQICGIQNDLDKTIEYAEKKSKKYQKYQTIIGEKDSHLKNREKIINKITSEENSYCETKDKLNKLCYNDEENKRLHETYTSQQSKYENMNNDITELKVEINKDKERLKEYEYELQKLDKIKIEQENLTDYIKLLEKIRDIYSKDGIQKILRDRARPAIQQNTMNIFNDFDFEYSALRIDENYDIQIENKNEILDLKMMSGGEKIAIALSLRLGIARYLSEKNTEILLLDEPTIHLDDEKRDKLIDIIGNNTAIPQMIVVTHDEGMEAISNNIIKIAKENGISYVDNS